jgi:plastocyanin
MLATKNSMDKRVQPQQKKIESMPVQGGVLGFVLVTLLIIGSLAVAAPSPLHITVGTFAPYYSPTFVRVGPNTPISWNNPTGALHSITHDGCKNGARCAFDSGPLGPNRTFTLHQLSPGSYPYHCSFHPIMRGVLEVIDSHPSNDT